MSLQLQKQDCQGRESKNYWGLVDMQKRNCARNLWLEKTHNDNGYHLFKAYQVPGVFVSAFHTLSHFILTSLRGKQYYLAVCGEGPGETNVN